MKTIFNGKLELKWYHIDDKKPFDDFFKKFPREDLSCCIGDNVIVLVNSDDDCDDPEVVQLSYMVDKYGREYWGVDDLTPFPEGHVKNIVYWANLPRYSKKSVEEFNEET